MDWNASWHIEAWLLCLSRKLGSRARRATGEDEAMFHIFLTVR